MGHELTEVEGGHAFVFNSEKGYPWHKLGNPVPGFMTLEQALEFSSCDDYVDLRKVYVLDDEGEYVEVPNYQATFSDIHGPLACVGMGYETVQCEEIMAIAASIIGLSEGEAAVDTMGRLGHGERFFCHIDFPALVIDPQGIADTIRRGLFVGTSFDGSMKNIIGMSAIREVCANTVRMSLGRLQQTISVAHRGNVQQHMQDAAAALGYAAAVEEALKERAERMLQIDGSAAMIAGLDAVWPTNDPDLGDKALARRNEIREDVRALYECGDHNAEMVGENGWAAYNAITEWLDHSRQVRAKGGHVLVGGATLIPASEHRRAEQTLLNVNSDVNQKKFAAANAIFALAA